MIKVYRLTLCALLLSAVLTTACGQNDRPYATQIQPSQAPGFAASARPWTSLQALDQQARFHFVVVTDRTGGEREGVFAAAMSGIDLMQPAFVLSVGDLIEGYTEDRAELTAEWDELDAFVESLDAPFFYTPGNHDYSNQVMADLWAERYGPSYYSFVYKAVLFVVLNSALFDREGVRGHGRRFADWSAEQAAQLAWLGDTLAAHADVRWTFLLMHRPYWRKSWKRAAADDSAVSASGPWPRHEGELAEWLQVEALLEDRDYTAFAGHMHTYEYTAGASGEHRHEKIALATTGGISEMRGVEYAEFDHFVWMTMTEDGPVMANVLLDAVLGKDHPMPLRRPYWAPSAEGEP